MLYLTDTALAEMLPAAQALQPNDITQLATDAAAVYQFLQGSPLATDHDLHTWAEANSLIDGRLNLAMQLLRKLGRVVELPVGSPAPSSTVAPRKNRRRKQ